MSQKHYDVLIATPGSSFEPEYVASLMRTTVELNKLGISYHFLNKYSSFVPSARELTALDEYGQNYATKEVGAGKYTYNKIFWIDSDMEWTPEDFLELYNSELDIISGMYATSPNRTIAANILDDKGRPNLVNSAHFLLDEDPVEVGGVGFGFVAVKAGVFESMKRPWFKIHEIQWDDIDYPVNMGEDYSWCQSAREAGYKIFLHPLIKLKHHKGGVYIL